MKQPASSYLRRFYYDLIIHDPKLLRVLIDMVGADRIVSGTDFPQGMAIMTSTFPRDFMAKAFSAFGPALGVAMIGGPPLGGFIINANLAGDSRASPFPRLRSLTLQRRALSSLRAQLVLRTRSHQARPVALTCGRAIDATRG